MDNNTTTNTFIKLKALLKETYGKKKKGKK